jgi:hypothetical protein
MAAPRDFLAVDLRGLGPALRSNARARGLTLSELTRQAVAAALETTCLSEPANASSKGDTDSERSAKLTVRLRPGVATRLSATARASGLSQSAYLATLIDGTPAPPLAVATEPGASTAQLAAVSADMNELIRTLARAGASSSPLIDDRLRPLLADVRRHLDLSSRLVSELRPSRQRSTARPLSEKACP